MLFVRFEIIKPFILCGDIEMDLEKLSLDELKELQNEVAVAIFNFEKKRKAETLAELEALAHAKGFSLKELLNNSNGKSTKKSVAPKYADPANLENTWTGRGRKPKWLVTALENGCTAEDFAIQKYE
jgi:DNA-binding protein H-NS